MPNVFVKDPQAVLDYAVDWRTNGWLQLGENITASTWTVESGITKEADAFNADKATVWLSGGTAGVIYHVTNRITTNQGRTDERTLYIRVADR